jgi:hypothetical protein
MNKAHRQLWWLLGVMLATVIGLVGGPTIASAQLNSDGYASSAADQQLFVGTWRLAEFKAETPTGIVVYPLGADAQGILTYTQSGRMNGTLWRSNRAPFAVNDQQKGTPDEYTAAVRSYVQYLGTWDVDPAAGTVTHHVEQSIFPNWNGTQQTRYYQFTDHNNGLILSTPPIAFGGTTIVATLSWVRVDRG